jgi:regulator of cell morphogenesis and NO signaling
MPALNRTASVAEIVGEQGAVASVFRKHESDEFRRSATLVPGVGRERHLDPDEAFPELEDAIAGAASELRRADSSRLSDADLVAHVVEHHHAYARRVLPYVVALLAKVVGSYGKRNAKLSALCDVGEELADTLDDHMEEEERELFPAFVASGTRRDTLRHGLEEMFRHHGEVRMLLMRIRWLADGFVAPEWGGRSYQVLMEELDALEEDVMEHMHVERYVLVPRLSRRYLDAR